MRLPPKLIRWAAYGALALVALEAGARLVEAECPALAGPFRDWRIPEDLGFQPGETLVHLGLGFTANAGGYRGQYHPRARSPGTRRIAVLGDDLAFGFGVEAELGWCQLLEDELNQRRALGQPGPRYEVLNFGVPRYNTHLEFLLFQHRVRRYQPDLLLLVLRPDDPANDRFVPDVLAHCPLEAPGADRLVAALVTRSGLLRVLHDTYCLLAGGTPGYVVSPTQLLDPESFEFRCAMHWLDRLREETRTAGIQLTVVAAPRLVAPPAAGAEAAAQERLLRWLGERGYQAIALHAELLPRADRLRFPGGDLNYEGHQQIASILAAALPKPPGPAGP